MSQNSASPGRNENDNEGNTDAASSVASVSEEQKSNNNDLTDNLEISREFTPPPLPLRPPRLTVSDEDATIPSGSLRISKSSPRPQLLSKATTAVSKTDIHKNEDTPTSNHAKASRGISHSQMAQYSARDDDTASVRSFRSMVPPSQQKADVESLLSDFYEGYNVDDWKDDDVSVNEDELFRVSQREEQFESQFESEFTEVGDVDADGSNEEQLMIAWKSKLKHFLILSSAGKPIYSRHGEDSVTSNSIGVIRTIISFFQESQDTLKGFTAGDARFVVLSKAHLYLVAISRLGESDLQLRNQLDALYMQILSTMTLPRMEKLFLNRPSADLRRPLEGTETLLSALSDTFTRGSPSSLLSALECLPLRKSDRAVINSAILTTKSPNLLYGLLMAGGRLASVLRPKKHSLHPGDLQLIFNMLFEASGVRRGGGESWIPLCLPGFNNTGYVYMYVSFISAGDTHSSSAIDETSTTPGHDDETSDNDANRPPSTPTRDDEVAIILISTNKESFFELRNMRDKLVQQLSTNGVMAVLQAAISKGRPTCSDIVPAPSGTPSMQHFLYKSRPNVQFAQPSPSPLFSTPLAWRRLLTLYAGLHAAGHGRPTAGGVKVHQRSGTKYKALAWVTPVFELYCVGDAAMAKAALAKAAERLVRWVQREEERLFIIGGAVF